MPREVGYLENWMRCDIAEHRRKHRGEFGRAAIAATARVFELARAIDHGPAERFAAAWDRVYSSTTPAERRAAVAEATEAHEATKDGVAQLYAAAVGWDTACPHSDSLASLVECVGSVLLVGAAQASHLEKADETLAALDRPAVPATVETPPC
jgi:hypothetical protein